MSRAINPQTDASGSRTPPQRQKLCSAGLSPPAAWQQRKTQEKLRAARPVPERHRHPRRRRKANSPLLLSAQPVGVFTELNQPVTVALNLGPPVERDRALPGRNPST